MKPEELELMLAWLTALELEPDMTSAEHDAVTSLMAFARYRLRDLSLRKKKGVPQ